MANKELRIVTDSDLFLAEIVITLRAGFGMKPAVYDPSLGALIVPDDYKAKKAK